MARDLNERDIEILRKLAPEIVEMERHGYQIEYMNILPPLANHLSRGLADFEQRLKKLSVDDAIPHGHDSPGDGRTELSGA